MASEVLNDLITELRVSSVLNRDVKQFGKKHLIDGDEDTCWNSQQGSPQWVSCVFGAGVRVSGVRLRFQGGFAGAECWLEGDTSRLHDFHPADTSALQTFSVVPAAPLTRLKLVFNSSTDFYGRVTLYSLEILGSGS